MVIGTFSYDFTLPTTIIKKEKEFTTCPISLKTKENGTKQHLEERRHETDVCRENILLDKPLLRCTPEGEEDLAHLYCKIPAENLPDDIKQMLFGLQEPLPDDHNLPSEQPSWLDINKVKQGQKFACKYLYGVSFADMLSLCILFSPPDGLNPLIYTENSHTPYLAYKRYLSTLLRVQSWYETEFWTPGQEGYKNLKGVRCLHLKVSKELNQKNPEEISRKISLEDKLNGNLWCPIIGKLQKDFEPLRNEYVSSNGCPYAIRTKKTIYLNQCDMALTQCGFFSLMVLHHKKLGVSTATESDLEAFVHLWRYIGYMLGVKDEYNFCRGTFAEVKTRCQNVTEYIAKPTLVRVSKNWEHMARCAYKGMYLIADGVSFETALLYLFWLLDLKAPSFLASVSTWDKLTLELAKYVMYSADKVPGLSQLLNYMMKNKIKHTLNLKPEVTQKWETKKFYN